MPIPSSSQTRQARRSSSSRVSGLTALAVLPFLFGSVAFAREPANPPASAGTIAVSTPFVASMLRNFDTWDTNHDGVLAESEVDAVLIDPKVKGDEAAVAASLKIGIRSKKYRVPAVNRDYLSRLDKNLAAAPARNTAPAGAREAGDAEIGDTTSASAALKPAVVAGAASTELSQYPPLERIRKLCLRRIQRHETDAFVGNAPELKAVHQGQLGDCYFLAVLGAMLNRDSAQVKSMISPSTNGSFDVSFPGAKKTHVPAFTDGEIALSSSATDSGRWVAVFEAAFGYVRNGIRNGDKEIAIPTDAIRDGGSIGATIHALTGHTARRITLRKQGVREMPSAEGSAKFLPALRRQISSALKEKRLIGAGTIVADLPPAVNPKHAYAIIGYDESADTVTLWNPHGNEFMPRGTPGLTNGYPTRNGVFTVPVAELARIFAGVSWEVLSGPEVTTAAVVSGTPAEP